MQQLNKLDRHHLFEESNCIQEEDLHRKRNLKIESNDDSSLKIRTIEDFLIP